MINSSLSLPFRLIVVHSLAVMASTSVSFCSFAMLSITPCAQDYGFVEARDGDTHHVLSKKG